jgi:hypothetical protein
LGLHSSIGYFFCLRPLLLLPLLNPNNNRLFPPILVIGGNGGIPNCQRPSCNCSTHQKRRRPLADRTPIGYGNKTKRRIDEKKPVQSPRSLPPKWPLNCPNKSCIYIIFTVFI